jgi:hypothetical protein
MHSLAQPALAGFRSRVLMHVPSLHTTRLAVSIFQNGGTVYFAHITGMSAACNATDAAAAKCAATTTTTANQAHAAVNLRSDVLDQTTQLPSLITGLAALPEM